jgi:CO/xanthine dehydrogenase FAD-binding subunit
VKAAPYEYVRPRTIDEAIELLARGDARPLAGGQSLVPLMAMRLSRPGTLVDLNHIAELATIELLPDGDLRIGAMVRQTDLLESTAVLEHQPLVAQVVPFIGHDEIRHRGTVGGSLAHGDPAAEWPALAVALDASIELTGPAGSRSLAARDLFEGPFMTALGEGELLVGVRLPPFRVDGWGFQEVARRSGDFALAGAIVTLRVADERVDQARVTLLAAAGAPVACHAAEEALRGTTRGEGAAVLAATLPPHAQVAEDIHATSRFRRHLLVTAARRALDQAWERT